MVTENIPKSQPRSLHTVTVRPVITLRQAERQECGRPVICGWQSPHCHAVTRGPATASASLLTCALLDIL